MSFRGQPKAARLMGYGAIQLYGISKTNISNVIQRAAKDVGISSSQRLRDLWITGLYSFTVLAKQTSLMSFRGAAKSVSNYARKNCYDNTI